jgi:hypothetical protein
MLFCLCFRCATTFKKKNTKIDYKCPHSDEERAFTSTITSIELSEALKQKYVVTQFYRAWEYTQFSNNIFKEYVRYENNCNIFIILTLSRFLKLKVESSVFPKEIVTEDEINEFVKGYKEILGVDIDKNSVKENSGLRHIAKLVINIINIFYHFNSRCLIRYGENFQ